MQQRARNEMLVRTPQHMMANQGQMAGYRMVPGGGMVPNGVMHGQPGGNNPVDPHKQPLRNTVMKGALNRYVVEHVTESLIDGRG
jgi:hypothetical protein